MIDVTQLPCSDNTWSEAGVHSFVPRGSMAAGRSQTCSYCGKTEAQIRKEAENQAAKG